MDNKPKEEKPKEKPKTITWQIPQCCLEGWPSCPHVLKKQRPVKKNVGL